MAKKTRVGERDGGSAAEYLGMPYMRAIVPEEDGTFRAEIVEFPGCIATGDTAEEALSALKDAAESWLEAALSVNQTIPPPLERNNGFSGKLMLRMPRSLHRRAAITAERDGASLNQFIVNCIAECIGARTRPQTAAQVINITQAQQVSRNSASLSGSLNGISQVSSNAERKYA